jgi:hypothetical protein
MIRHAALSALEWFVNGLSLHAGSGSASLRTLRPTHPIFPFPSPRNLYYAGSVSDRT